MSCFEHPRSIPPTVSLKEFQQQVVRAFLSQDELDEREFMPQPVSRHDDKVEQEQEKSQIDLKPTVSIKLDSLHSLRKLTQINDQQFKELEHLGESSYLTDTFRSKQSKGVRWHVSLPAVRWH
eukprot:g8326.t1